MAEQIAAGWKTVVYRNESVTHWIKKYVESAPGQWYTEYYTEHVSTPVRKDHYTPREYWDGYQFVNESKLYWNETANSYMYPASTYTVVETKEMTVHYMNAMPPVYQVNTYTDRPSLYTFTSNCSTDNKIYLSKRPCYHLYTEEENGQIQYKDGYADAS